MTKERKEELRKMLCKGEYIGDAPLVSADYLEECLDFIDELQEEFNKCAGFLWAHGMLENARDPEEQKIEKNDVLGTWEVVDPDLSKPDMFIETNIFTTGEKK